MISFTFLALSLKDISKNREIKMLAIPIFISIIQFLIYYSFSLNYNEYDITLLIIPYTCVISSYSLNFTDKDMTRLLTFYICLALLIGAISARVYSTISYGSDDMYLIAGKNQIGAILSIALTSSFYLSLIKEGIKKYLYALGAIIGISISSAIGCRSAFLAALLCIVYLFYKRTTGTKNFYKVFAFTFVSTPFIIYFAHDIIINFLNDFFIGERGAYQSVDDISSGRIDRNIAALSYIGSNLFHGEFIYKSGIPLIHNYILLRLVRYGLFALPLIVYYIQYIYIALKQTTKSDLLIISKIGFYIIIIPYVISMLEPQAPFGPGSVYIMVYILFGYSLNKVKFNKL